MPRRSRALFSWTALLLLGGGCGGPASVPPTADMTKVTVLNDVAELCRSYQAAHNKPPAKLDDLAPLSQGGPLGFMALQKGEVVLRYEAAMPSTEEGSHGGGDEVLAYEKQAPESGGQVLMLDRTVRSMTADEFKAAKKAGK